MWTFIKPGADAYRVATKAEIEDGQTMDNRSAMSLARIIEMVFEAVPGAIIQTVAIFYSNKYRQTAAYLPLFSSFTTAAFLSTLISWGWDSSKDNRKKHPGFYGYIGSTYTK